jgi:hypothetical protein
MNPSRDNQATVIRPHTMEAHVEEAQTQRALSLR